jgi:glutathione peroxidase
MESLHALSAKSLDNRDIKLDTYKGNVLLIVNTASKCGLTPQYEDLQKLHEKYADKGLRILGFPCNQFAGQEPGNAEEIGTFCQRNYGVEFQMFDKIDVNGPNAHPIYKALTNEGKEPIEWNFAKFLVDANGNVVKRYPAKSSPTEAIPDIENALQKASAR